MITENDKRNISLMAKSYRPAEIRRLLQLQGVELPYSQIVYYSDVKAARLKQSKAAKKHYDKKKAILSESKSI